MLPIACFQRSRASICKGPLIHSLLCSEFVELTLRLGMMKKQRFLVYTEYVFDGVFDVVAESKEEARQKVLQDCGLVMGGSIHSTLPDDEINWAFDRHPNKRIDRITKV